MTKEENGSDVTNIVPLKPKQAPEESQKILNQKWGQETMDANYAVIPSCPIPDVCIDERRLPLFIARATLRDLVAGLKARATGGAAR